MARYYFPIVFCVSFIYNLTPIHAAIHNIKEIETEIGIKEKFNEKMDIKSILNKDDGKPFSISEILNQKKPIIIVPVYFQCTQLCTFTMRGFLAALNSTKKYKIGRDFYVLNLSMNYRETAEEAKKAKLSYMDSLNYTQKEKELARQHWQFLTGDKKSVSSFLNNAGFYFKEDGKEFAHTAGLIFLTPDGRVSRYLYGIEFAEKDFELAILESGSGHIGSVIDQLVLYCFRYDPTKRHYGLIAFNVMRIGSAGGAILLLGILVFYIIRKKTKNEE